MMQQLVGRVRRCIQDYQMIAPGDRIAVGLSGGKDSLVTLLALHALSRYRDACFTLEAITLDLGFEGVDLAPLSLFVEHLGLRHTVIQTGLADTIRAQKGSACAICAHLRRGTLHKTAKALNCNKVALGHHFDDAVETTVMSLFHDARFHCFRPVTHLDRAGLHLIRPLLYVEEQEIILLAKSESLPVVHNPCPKNGCSSRSDIKALIATLELGQSGLRRKIMTAMQTLPLPGWQPIPRA